MLSGKKKKRTPIKIAGVWITALDLFGRVGWSVLVFHLGLRVRVEGYILGSGSKLVESLPVLYIFQIQVETTLPFFWGGDDNRGSVFKFYYEK